jgi:hypothetical protein
MRKGGPDDPRHFVALWPLELRYQRLWLARPYREREHSTNPKRSSRNEIWGRETPLREGKLVRKGDAPSQSAVSFFVCHLSPESLRAVERIGSIYGKSKHPRNTKRHLVFVNLRYTLASRRSSLRRIALNLVGLSR